MKNLLKTIGLIGSGIVLFKTGEKYGEFKGITKLLFDHGFSTYAAALSKEVEELAAAKVQSDLKGKEEKETTEEKTDEEETEEDEG